MMSELNMKAPRLYLDIALHAGAVHPVSDPHFHYLVHVLRFKSTESVLLFNVNSGEWLAEFSLTGKKNAEFRVKQKMHESVPCKEMHLFFAPLKRGPLDFIIEKATELGVTHFHPVITEYTQVHHFNVEKYQQTAIEAAEQCERFDVPMIFETETLVTAIEGFKGKILWADEGLARHAEVRSRNKFGMTERLGHAELVSASDCIAGLVGPEGGFSPRERQVLSDLGNIVPCHLGPRILRAETAALVMLVRITFGHAELVSAS